MAVGIPSDHRLQQRRGGLVGQRDQPDLAKAEVERALEQRIDRQHQRLNRVIQEMTEADGDQHAIRGGIGGGTVLDGGGHLFYWTIEDENTIAVE